MLLIRDCVLADFYELCVQRASLIINQMLSCNFHCPAFLYLNFKFAEDCRVNKAPV